MRTHKTGCVHTTWDRHTTSRPASRPGDAGCRRALASQRIARQLAIHAKMLHTAAGCTGVGQQETNVHTYTARDQRAYIHSKRPGGDAATTCTIRLSPPRTALALHAQRSQHSRVHVGKRTVARAHRQRRTQARPRARWPQRRPFSLSGFGFRPGARWREKRRAR